jgi:protein-S-isoprenylcysteine O-methyltransferase Ste14
MVRYLCLALPLAVTLAAAGVERDHRARGAALLAFIAAAVGLAVLNEAARLAGWYGFAPVAGVFRGMPVDLWIGWAALWGAAPVLLRRQLPLPVALGLLLWLDVLTMPRLSPLVRLGPHWLLGEAVGLAAVALPVQLLGRFTADGRHLRARVLLQVAVFTTMTLWLLPTVAFEFGDGSWARLGRLPRPWQFVGVQVAALVAAPALAAVREFASRGAGTPFPWDPPRRLVSTGPYAYLANPMQVSLTGLLLLGAAAAGSAALAAAAVTAAAFAVGVAGPHEQVDLDRRYGPSWQRYRRQVRAWWPRWRPYLPGSDAALWLDEQCEPCAGTGAFLRHRRPIGLTLAPAGAHQRPLTRAEYVGGDGHRERGVAAVARGLEHVNLGWAYLGWLLRLPGVGWLAQVVTDAVIAPPHPAGRPRGEGWPTPDSDCSTGRLPPSGSTASPASPPVPSPPPPGPTRR